jgi:hypothetical protein
VEELQAVLDERIRTGGKHHGEQNRSVVDVIGLHFPGTPSIPGLRGEKPPRKSYSNDTLYDPTRDPDERRKDWKLTKPVR